MTSSALNLPRIKKAILSSLFLAITAFFFLGLFLFAAPNVSEPAYAVNYATNLVATSQGCGATGKVSVTFNWTQADDPSGGTVVTKQFFDWAFVQAQVANPPTGYGGRRDVLGQSTTTFTDTFAPNTDHYWRINTEYYPNAWSPSLTPYPKFNFSCAATPTPPPVGGTTGELDCAVKTGFATRQEWWNYSRWIRAMCDGYADQTTFSLSQFDSTVDSLGVAILGFSSIQSERNDAIAGTGALAGVGRVITVAYKDPPFSGVQYLAGEFQKLNPVQPAYAQGIGYDTLVPVQEAWTAMRNIAYIGFVIVFVVIGFMIMFRSHISPQAVATLQDSLPRIVVALILVTFSYAIAGLMLDIMFLLLNVAILALPGDADAKNIVFEKSIIGVIAAGWGGTFRSAFDSIDKMFDAVFKLPRFVDWAIGGLVAIIVGIAMLFVMIKILISLLISYATILILTIFSPFFFLLQALPGNNSATTWFKQMAANIAVFPAVALMIILAGYLAGIGEWGFPDGPAISATAGNIQKFPLLAGDIPSSALGALAGIAILMMTPGAADLVKNTIGAKSPGGGAMGAAAGGALAMGANTASAPFRHSGKEASEAAQPYIGDRLGRLGRGATREYGKRIDAGTKIERGETGPR